MISVNTSSLLEVTAVACDRWRSTGANVVVVEKLRDELDHPGSQAGVVCRFIGGEYADEGKGFEAVLQGKAHRADEIGDAFNHVLDFLRGLGKPGVELAKALRTKNRNLL
jgi:hypothetical protein